MIVLNSDVDIKIAGDKPSKDIFKSTDTFVNAEEIDKKTAQNAKLWGKEVALKFIEDAKESQNSGNDYVEMLVQRCMLLSFTATAGFEIMSENDTISGIAQKSFIDTLKNDAPDIYASTADTGAYSFYFLAFRRGGEIERRIGQTFAMLCSHDGDPIFQELGEALYCWFLSVIKSLAKQFNIL